MGLAVFLIAYYLIGVFGVIRHWTADFNLHWDILAVTLVLFWVIGPFLLILSLIPRNRVLIKRRNSE